MTRKQSTPKPPRTRSRHHLAKASILPHSCEPSLSPLDSNKECAIATFFRKRGYEYSWDFSKHDGLHWHEIYDGDNMVMQVEMGIPLKQLKNDLLNADDFTAVGYFLAVKNHDALEKLCDAIRRR